MKRGAPTIYDMKRGAPTYAVAEDNVDDLARLLGAADAGDVDAVRGGAGVPAGRTCRPGAPHRSGPAGG